MFVLQLRMDYRIPGFINIEHMQWVREDRRRDRELRELLWRQFDTYDLRMLFGEDIEEEEEEW